MTFTKSLIHLVRAPNGITAISNILAAAVIASSNNLTFSVIYLMLASLFIYYAGMIFNDCFDIKKDTAERPERPLPSGDISASFAWGLAVIFTLLGIAFAAMHSFNAMAIAIALAGAVLVYDGFVKQGLIGALAMGLCRYINWLLGAVFVVGSGLVTTDMLIMALPIGLYITSLTYLSKQEVSADNINALHLTSILLISTVAVIFGIIWGLLAHSIIFNIVATLILAAGSYSLYQRINNVKQAFEPKNIQAMIGWMIMAIIPLDAFMVAINGHFLWAAIILTLLPLCRYLSRYAYLT